MEIAAFSSGRYLALTWEILAYPFALHVLSRHTRTGNNFHVAQSNSTFFGHKYALLRTNPWGRIAFVGHFFSEGRIYMIPVIASRPTGGMFQIGHRRWKKRREAHPSRAARCSVSSKEGEVQFHTTVHHLCCGRLCRFAVAY